MAGKTGLPGRISVGPFVCTECKLSFCEGCLDIKRSVYSSERLCQCQKKEHEPALSAVTQSVTSMIQTPSTEK